MTTIPKSRCHFDSILGFPAPLPLLQLATNRKVVNYYHYQGRIMPGNSTSSFIAQLVADEVISLWEFAGIPNFVNFFHHLKGTDKREKDAYNTEISTFDSLFDVTTCKCYEFSFDRKDCSCLMKVPLYEWEFTLIKDTNGSR